MAQALLGGLFARSSAAGRFDGDTVYHQPQEEFLRQYAYQTDGTGRSDHVGVQKNALPSHEEGIRPFRGLLWPPRGLKFDAAQGAEDVRTRRDMMRMRQPGQGWKLKRDFSIRYANAVKWGGEGCDLARYYEKILDNWHSDDTPLIHDGDVPQQRATVRRTW